MDVRGRKLAGLESSALNDSATGLAKKNGSWKYCVKSEYSCLNRQSKESMSAVLGCDRLLTYGREVTSCSRNEGRIGGGELGESEIHCQARVVIAFSASVRRINSSA